LMLERNVAWSPGGLKIAFDARPIGGGGESIYVMNPDGSGRTSLTDGTTPDSDQTWSPDGRRIAFVRHLIGTDDEGDPTLLPADIYVMNSDGSSQVRLSSLPGDDLDPAWSPDGTKIAFYRSDGDLEVYVMNANGRAPSRLTDNSVNDLGPEWSPDGTRIVFQTNRDGNYEIYAMNADGSTPINLTRDPAGDAAPAWSPDGQKIAFASSRSGNDEVYVMNADGTGSTNLSAAPEPDERPDWQPIPLAPRRSDYKNASKFCKAEREFLGADAFDRKYGGSGSSLGKCVSAGT
jgi:Tol biopolymer transport system component